jgi:hypothetical protein
MLKLELLRLMYQSKAPAADPTGVTTTCGVPLNFIEKLTVIKQPAGGPPPVLMLTVPAVSVPLTDAVPPEPTAVPLDRQVIADLQTLDAQ